jgi:hypothetical protein
LSTRREAAGFQNAMRLAFCSKVRGSIRAGILILRRFVHDLQDRLGYGICA